MQAGETDIETAPHPLVSLLCDMLIVLFTFC